MSSIFTKQRKYCKTKKNLDTDVRTVQEIEKQNV